MRVGTSQRDSQLVPKLWDHPHACGDKYPTSDISPLSVGSSPCVWGQDRLFTNLVDSLRIIPMRVGTRFEVLPT